MEQDTIVKQTVVISNSYTSRKGLTYQELNSKPEDWVPGKIKDVLQIKPGKFIPVYHKGAFTSIVHRPNGEVIRYENTEPTQEDKCIGWSTEYGEEYPEAITRFHNEGGCQLCGHWIVIECVLINSKTKQHLIVGTECVSNSYGKVISKVIKEFRDNETRKKAKLFLVKYIEWANTQKVFTTPANSFEKERLTFEAYIGRKLATQMLEDFDKISVRKLSNFIKKYEKDLLVPATVQLDGAYSVTNLKELVKAFDNKQTHLKVGFGKYRDMLISEVDPSYISWARENQNGS